MKYPRLFLHRLLTVFFLAAQALIPPCALTAQASPVPAYAGEPGGPVPEALTLPPALGKSASAGLLWAGSWGLSGIHEEEGGGIAPGSGSLDNRVEVKASALGLTARFQALDKRPALVWGNPGSGLTQFSGGIYHNGTGSRLLYGVLDEWGLSARLKKPWGKAAPFAEARRSLAADLKAEPSSVRKNEAYLYLGSPRLGKFRAFGSVQADTQWAPAFGGGADVQFAKKTSLRAEGFYTQKRLDPVSPSSWFSFPPSLPERDFRFGAAGLFFTSPFFGAAFDGAYSQTFAWGRDVYGNLALRLGDKPWLVSLAADAAGSRFVDRDGSAVGAGFRTAARFDLKGKGSSLFRTALTLRSPEIGELFNRGGAEVSYRFPSSLKFPLPFGVSFRPGTMRIGAARDGRDREKAADAFDAGASFYLGPVRAAFTAALTYTAGRGSYDFNSVKASGELSYYTGPFSFRTKAAYTGIPAKPPVWDVSWYMSVRGKMGRPGASGRSGAGYFNIPGRFSVKVSSPDFPKKWACGLSWRLELQTVKR
jgi:hypothetical protein